ncbi:hypothetical protein [Falsiphaeobacter marinintestinus]|uniref:hypothetical protein n=1 Tax=Falsiphaeobacter marinintestinus TaxID=1492905 RepID=UPI001647ABA6|nr:hypothetical protein [Phaeobacter marinintestinus]
MLVQKYTTTCSGGLVSKYKGSSAAFEVELMPDGRTLVEITTSDGSGNIIYLKEYR